MTSTPTRTIEITVSPEGATTIKPSGFTGSTCKDATKELERALGIAGNDRVLPEFYARTGTGDRVQQGS
jgi:hypothetical protein